MCCAAERLNSSPPQAAQAAKTPRVCRECGQSFHAVTALFCGRACRLAFNNRRIQRGGELYDLFMAMRYERGLAKALGVWKMICRMAQMFRAEDMRDRAGRKSWRDPETVLERHSYLFATVVYKPRSNL